MAHFNEGGEAKFATFGIQFEFLLEKVFFKKNFDSIELNYLKHFKSSRIDYQLESTSN
jgi:hypothetical protein